MRSEKAGTMSRFRSFGGWLSLMFGLLFTGTGLWLAVGGFRLIALGGSFYYSIAGIALAGLRAAESRREVIALSFPLP